MNASKRISRGCRLAAVLACCLALACARADDTTPLLDLPPSAFSWPEVILSATNGMYGWNFWLLRPVVVTGVGWYDEGGDGLLNSHQIGLWQGSYYNYTGLVFSAAVPAGTAAPLDGNWRKVNFNVSLTLQPGYYVIGGTYRGGSDDVVRFSQGFKADPRVFTSPTDIRSVEPFSAVGGGFRAPDEGILLTGAEFGPTLFVEPIPEAPPSALFALGLGIWVVARAGRRSSARARPGHPAGLGPRHRTPNAAPAPRRPPTSAAFPTCRARVSYLEVQMRTSKQTHLPPVLSVALLCLFALASARAGDSVPLLSPREPLNSPEAFPPGTNAMYGWTFQLLQPVVVAGVGWYDQGQDGLLNSHEIGVWQGSYDNYTSLVFSASVPAGTAAPLEGYWREVDFNVSLTLQPGSYVVAGTRRGPSDDEVEFTDEVSIDPRVAPDSVLPMVSSGGFGAPTEGPIVYGAEFGPMLFVEPIPEAPPSALLALGLCSWLAVGAGHRRFAREAAA